MPRYIDADEMKKAIRIKKHIDDETKAHLLRFIEIHAKTENFCVLCGEIIPEGRQVCASCERKITKGDHKNDGNENNTSEN